MTKTVTTSVRIVFASFALALLVYAGLDAALTGAAGRGTIGLSSCGDAANPCALAPLTVTAPDARLIVDPAPIASTVELAES